MEAYDELIAALDGAMVVVTASNGDEVDGCLVGFHSQCSIEPRRHAVWLSVANRTHEVALGATHLVVNVLDDADRDLAEHFGGRSGDDVDKLSSVAWRPGPGGAPVLERASGWFGGPVTTTVTADADHQLFVVAIDEAGGGPPHEPLRLTAVTDIEPGHEAEERR